MGFVYFYFPFEPACFYTLQWNQSLLFHSPFPCGSTNNPVDVTQENWVLSSYSQLALSLHRNQPIQNGA